MGECYVGEVWYTSLQISDSMVECTYKYYARSNEYMYEYNIWNDGKFIVFQFTTLSISHIV